MEYRFNENNFTEEVMNSNIPVMIDFYAEWCGPCRMMSPLVEQFAEEYEGKVKIGKIYIVTHGPDEENPFALNDVTEQAKGYSKWINDNIWDLNRMQKQPEEYEIEPGDQCDNPYRSWYYDYCHRGETTECRIDM